MKRITFLTGYYGSGKSEITINLAIQKHVNKVIDLDIINPYFRSREMEQVLLEHGIDSISSDMDAKMHLDMPYISSKIYQPFLQKDVTAIYDLGGNDQGAKLLRQFEDYDFSDVAVLLVCNIYRTETDSAKKIVQLIHKIEGMGGKKVTGLINNSNLLKETTLEEIKAGEVVLKDVEKMTGLSIIYTTVWDQIDVSNVILSGELIPLQLYFRKHWL